MSEETEVSVITHWLEADELPRCQHCPQPADERSFMCEDCSSQADEETDTLREQLRGAVEALRPFAALADVADDFGVVHDDEWLRWKKRVLENAARARDVVRGR